MPIKEKKNEARKAKKKGGEIFLSAHARTSQANILHLDQKVAKFTTRKQLCGKLYFFFYSTTVTRKPLG